MIKKQYLKTACKVTFTLPIDAAANSVHLVGDFNGWDRTATPLEQKKKIYQVTLKLEPGREYQFLYLLDGETWRAEDEADRQDPNPYAGHNSVLVL